MAETENPTLVKNAIHNPNEPRHFMRIVPAATRQVVSVAGQVIADSENSLVVKEVGSDIYDPVTYFPRADVDLTALVTIDKTTHCPLKGDTEYFDVVVDGERISEAAWSYVEMVAGHELRTLIAFDQSRISVTNKT